MQRVIELIDQITKNMEEHEIKDFYIQLKKIIEIIKQSEEENDALLVAPDKSVCHNKKRTSAP